MLPSEQAFNIWLNYYLNHGKAIMFEAAATDTVKQSLLNLESNSDNFMTFSIDKDMSFYRGLLNVH